MNIEGYLDEYSVFEIGFESSQSETDLDRPIIFWYYFTCKFIWLIFKKLVAYTSGELLLWYHAMTSK